MRALKKTTALIAIAGMLTTPLAMAQDGASEPSAENGNATVQNQSQGVAAGLEQATGMSTTTLAVIGGVVVAGVAIAVSDGSSSSGTN